MIIDLTHPLKNGISIFPGSSTPAFNQINNIPEHGFAQIEINMCTHMGTHIDAPAHILENTKTLDQFPLEKFIGAAITLDCSNVKSISLEFLKIHEQQIRQVEFLLFYSGWQHKWSTPAYIDSFPTLNQAATEWLLQMNLKALGFDSFSIDPIDSKELPNHRLVLAKELLIIENMNNLEQTIGKNFELNCIPLKIEKADGAPVRVFARL